MTSTILPRSNIGSLAAITAGEGPLVLLIHGVGLRAEAWGAQIDALSATCRVIAVDMPGHGGSAPLPATPTLTRWFGAEASAQRTACETWLRSADPAGYRAAYRVFAHENGPSASDLAVLYCPALFLTGADEPNSTPAMSCDYAAHDPRRPRQRNPARIHHILLIAPAKPAPERT